MLAGVVAAILVVGIGVSSCPSDSHGHLHFAAAFGPEGKVAEAEFHEALEAPEVDGYLGGNYSGHRLLDLETFIACLDSSDEPKACDDPKDGQWLYSALFETDDSGTNCCLKADFEPAIKSTWTCGLPSGSEPPAEIVDFEIQQREGERRFVAVLCQTETDADQRITDNIPVSKLGDLTEVRDLELYRDFNDEVRAVALEQEGLGATVKTWSIDLADPSASAASIEQELTGKSIYDLESYFDQGNGYSIASVAETSANTEIRALPVENLWFFVGSPDCLKRRKQLLAGEDVELGPCELADAGTIEKGGALHLGDLSVFWSAGAYPENHNRVHQDGPVIPPPQEFPIILPIQASLQ